MFFGWFGTVIGESEAGMYNDGVDKSFRMGMMWFIFSEVMFFAAFFGALFYARQLSVPWLGGEGSEVPDQPVPVAGLRADLADQRPGGGRRRVRDDAGASASRRSTPRSCSPRGVTITIAHHALKAGNRGILKIFLAATFLLGFLFVCLQASEYHHAYTELNLKLGSGIYGSTFFMLTGFHGLHVTIGAIMLTVIWLRVDEGPLHAEAPLRLRGRGLVLALRRRGLAGPVHLRLLAVDGRVKATGYGRIGDRSERRAAASRSDL